MGASPIYQPTSSFDKAILVNLDGLEKFYLPRVSAMRNETGNPIGVVVVLQDVTRFRVADDVKTDLIATVSHELKTPLTSMQMAVYLLLEEKIGPLNPKQTELLLAARNNSDRLFEMIEDLLDLARFEGGATMIQTQKPVAARSLLEVVAERERRTCHLAEGFDCELQIGKPSRIFPMLPSAAPRIDQVFANFISNAVEILAPARRHHPLSPRGRPIPKMSVPLVRFSVQATRARHDPQGITPPRLR